MAAPPLPAVFGDWRGQAQYQLSAAGQWVDQAHAVVTLNLSLNAEGKVIGSSQENGCRLLGLWTRGFAPSVLELDVTLSHCSYPGLNHRYHGQLAESVDGHTSQLSLNALAESNVDARFNAELKANLRR